MLRFDEFGAKLMRQTALVGNQGFVVSLIATTRCAEVRSMTVSSCACAVRLRQVAAGSDISTAVSVSMWCCSANQVRLYGYVLLMSKDMWAR